MTDWTTEEMETPEGTTPQADSTDSQANDWERKYKELQSDYTKKSQKLSELEKSQQRGDNQFTEEQQQWYDWNKSLGFATKEEIESARKEALEAKQAIQEQEFSNLLRSYPDLGKFESAIRTLQKAEWGSYEEIVLKHKFASADKLERAKSWWSIVGGNLGKQEKKPSEMSSQEWADFKKKNGLDTRTMF